MNVTISTFLKIAITVVSISAFLFVVAYNMADSETTHYQTEIETERTLLP
ncbi:hypothetical protein ACQKFO_21330 [Rossellomorea sp. NPDC071047]